MMSKTEKLPKNTVLEGRKGAYQIIERIGVGSFGETYRASERQKGNRQCVVKRLMLESLILRQDAQRRFKLEAEVLERLGHHEQIPTLWDDFEDKQEFYLVQDFIDGNVLSEEINDGKRWSEGRVIGILYDVLQVLKFIGQQEPPVIHRDIKPGNLIRRKSDRKIVVIDFGAVKEIVGTSQGLIGSVIGTRGYQPKEQEKGNPKPNSDIYALGMTAIYSLTGVHPRELNNDSEASEVIWREGAQVSDRLAGIIDKMICYDYKKRYQSATDVLNVLDELHNIGDTVYV